MNMKKIVLSPVKNEAWIIRDFLKNASWADLILLADQHSADDTRNIASEFPNVRMIDNDDDGHSNRVRWLLLDEARRIFPNDDKLIFCLDADEIISAAALEKTISIASSPEYAKKAVRFSYSWIQLFESFDRYRIDGVWKDNIRSIAFADSPARGGHLEYPKSIIINDHTERIPEPIEKDSSPLIHIAMPVLHLHFLAKKRSEIKQAWYMCQEMIAGSRSAKRINLAYSPSMLLKPARTEKAPQEWTRDLQLPSPSAFESTDEMREAEILRIFDQHGIEKFEPLDIWRNPELLKIFESKTGRKPRPEAYPQVLVSLYRFCPSWIRNLGKKIMR